MKAANRQERGFMSFSAILGLAAIAVTFFAAVRLLPPFVANYEFQGYIRDAARTATYNTVSAEDLKRQVIDRAGEFGISLDESRVAVNKTREGFVGIAITYEVPVDLVARQVVLHFEPSASSQNIGSQ